MKSYEELRNEFLEEVSKIDVSKLLLSSYSGRSLKEYAELLTAIADIPYRPKYLSLNERLIFEGEYNNRVPKVESEGE